MSGTATAEADATRPLRRRLYLLAFVDEFGPIYAVYTLWFNDNGISTPQISTAFLIWAIAAVAFEIPSGALADTVDRRRLLAGAFVVRAIGITIWLVWPTFAGLLVGAVLWAVHDAAASGAWEAMIHDQLRAVGRAADYPVVIARIGQFSHVGVAAGTLLGAGLLQVDVSLTTLGWLTVAAHAGSITLVLALPDASPVRLSTPPGLPPSSAPNRTIGAGPVAEQILDDVGTAETWSYAAWWSALRGGVAEARRSPVVGRVLILVALLEGLFILDEYVPLLARARGGDDAAAPIIVFVVWLGLLLGGELAARLPAISGRALGALLIVATGVTTVAFVVESVWALMLIAVGYAALEAGMITGDARLQERTPDATRATVTSVGGFGSAVVSMLAFVVIGAMADGDDPTPG
ncbi:MAG: MFS transporter, partial [Ilumatobacter sp.]|nr:MFS transporter [Ilumatobacter sp.]